MNELPYPLFTWVWARVMVDGEVRHLVGRVFGRSFVRRRYDVKAGDKLYQHIPAEDVAMMDAQPPVALLEYRPEPSAAA